MRNIVFGAVLPRDRRPRFLMSVAASFLIVAPHAIAQAPTNAGPTRQDMQVVKSAADARKSIDVAAIQQPLMRITAAMTNAAVADTRAYDAELDATGVEKILTLEGLTPGSPVLDHCDKISFMVERANAMGGRYADYIALARKQGEIEIAAHQLQPIELAGFLDGMAKQRTGFEQRWAATAGLAREAAALCTVLARRHWRVGPSDVLEIEEPDLTEAQRLTESVQQAAQHLVALDQARNEEAKQQMEKLPSGR
ncbi:MAG TPA: hypothetical protein VNT42_09340 [Sphingomonas sp.]|nr:hypothetical protein [Sphingomonas sp.]